MLFSCFLSFTFLTKNLCLNSTEEKQGKNLWFVAQWESRESGGVGLVIANFRTFWVSWVSYGVVPGGCGWFWMILVGLLS